MMRWSCQPVYPSCRLLRLVDEFMAAERAIAEQQAGKEREDREARLWNYLMSLQNKISELENAARQDKKRNEELETRCLSAEREALKLPILKGEYQKLAQNFKESRTKCEEFSGLYNSEKEKREQMEATVEQMETRCGKAEQALDTAYTVHARELGLLKGECKTREDGLQKALDAMTKDRDELEANLNGIRKYLK